MSDQFTGYIVADAAAGGDSRYRWYLCVEKHPEIWACQQVNRETALAGATSIRRTKAVPIHYTNPPFLDRLYIRAALQPTVTIVKPTYAERGPE